MSILQLFPALFLTMLCVISLFLLINVLLPGLTQQVYRILESSQLRAFTIGIVNLLFWTLGLLILGNAGQQTTSAIWQGLFLLLASVLVLGMALGITGLLRLLGQRLLPHRSETVQVAFGATVAFFACITPYIGWFGVLPLLGSHGLGAIVLLLLQRREST
jgi:predicted membrane protein